MNVIDTSSHILRCFDAGRFDLEKWRSYMDACVPGAKEMCLADMRETVRAGYSWEKAFLPVLDAVQDADRRRRTIGAFRAVTEHLDERIAERFGRTVDADLILYLGLCSGAGWVVRINGKPAVLLGIEKIIELGWYDRDAMTGLVIHELGHIYQDQYGVLRREFEALPDRFLWQLFTEGIAMVFEQEIMGDPGYFHQDRDGWKQWCDAHAGLIRRSFADDLRTMTPENQRWFGDWVRFGGRGDTGYYLGARFVRYLLGQDPFDRIILYGIPEVRAGFEGFLRSDI